MTNAEWYAFYAELGARDAKAVKALIDQAKAKVDTFVTKDALATEKAAVEAAIKALPAVVTLNDKDAVKAAWDANEAYAAKNGATPAYNVGVLNTAVAQLALIERKAIEKEISNLPAIVTAADKDAVNAAYANAKAYNKLVAAGSGDMYEGQTAVSTTTLQTKFEKIRDLDRKAVEAAIDAIPLHVIEADKATVEAARKAFDAFVAEYEDLEAPYNAYATVANRAELFAAEDALKDLINPEEAAKSYVQDLSIKARSVKTSKGVKVTIKADVQTLLDAGFTVEYKFYRSTKSNAKFGTAKVTKTENTYLNTAGTKGTRYYYKAKLVVKNAAGEVVATTPLTQCLYATRTF